MILFSTNVLRVVSLLQASMTKGHRDRSKSSLGALIGLDFVLDVRNLKRVLLLSNI